MNSSRTDYSAVENKKKRKKIHPVNIIRVIVQLASFIIMPGLFISIFSSIGSIYTAIIQGTFNIADQAWHIVLTAGIMILTFIWGRFFCGFFCSFGAMQDLLWFGGKRMPKKIKVSEKADRILKLLKFAVLLFVVLGVWTFSVTGTTLWSPWTIFGMYATVKGFPSGAYLLSIGGALMLVILIGSFLIERFFCKYLCPLGAIYSLISRFRIFRIKKPATACGNCRLCTSKCSMSIPMYKHDSIRSGECINCMKCTTVCHRENIKADIAPAVSGTAAVATLMGVYFAGSILPSSQVNNEPITAEIAANVLTGQFKDGTYTGTGSGYRGNISLTVTVSGGNITSITVNESRDDNEFFSRAQSKVIPSIISSQSVDVDTVSGATYSSRGIIEAVKNALGDQLIQSGSSESSQQPTEENSNSNGFNKHEGKRKHSRNQDGNTFEMPQEGTKPERPAQESKPEESSSVEEHKEESKHEESSSVEESTEESKVEESSSVEESSDESKPEESSYVEESSAEQGRFTDGVYTGTGTGYRGATNVTVTVSGGKIVDITVDSYRDDGQFFNRASNGIISSVINQQSTDVDT